MNPQKNVQEEDELEKATRIEKELREQKLLSDFKPSHELNNEEQDEIWNTNDGYAE